MLRQERKILRIRTVEVDGRGIDARSATIVEIIVVVRDPKRAAVPDPCAQGVRYSRLARTRSAGDGNEERRLGEDARHVILSPSA
jgi:hypothetical protein